ncbi:MAG: PEP-CTERM sorting domain-containing protein [Thauera sp.]|jgi:hypothetical protein|nr:PEP-CTERM sorting domain-containing protein [Thauera sp.]
MKNGMALLAAIGIATLSASAQAALIRLEVSGNLAYGTDRTNVFGLGANASLVGRAATFSWLMSSDALGPDRNADPTISGYGCSSLVPGCTYFMSASVTINGVARTLAGRGSDLTNDVRMFADTDGAGPASADGYYLRMGQTRDVGSWYLDEAENWYRATTRIASKVEISVNDKIDSILAGLDPAELHGWSTSLLTGTGDNGSAVFVFSEMDLNGVQVYEFATGSLLLADSSTRWWTEPTAGTGQGTGGTSNPSGGGSTNGPVGTVPEPATIALLGLGLGLLRRKSRRHSGRA